jgi:hypothetical protein
MPEKQTMEVSPRVGLLGELEVEMQLARRGWHPVRLDTAQMASNADLLAVNREKRVSIQIKTTDAEKQHSHYQWLGFGYSTGYLRDKKPIFNSKKSPLIADVIVAVNYRANASQFIVLPVALIERLCRAHANYWYKVPAKKRDTGKLGTRSDSFPLYLCFDADPGSHAKHHERMKRNLQAYKDKWDVLDEPIAKLHNPAAWQLLK